MTQFTDREKRDALAWADSGDFYAAAGIHIGVLATVLRAAEKERDEYSALADKNGAAVMANFKRAQEAEKEVAALKAKVESMGKVVEAVKKYRDGMPYNSCGCYLTDRMEMFAALAEMEK